MNGYPGCTWGSALWHFLHVLSFSYPEYTDDEMLIRETYNFFNSLKYILPCDECREHYKQNFKKLEQNLNSRENLIKWVYNLHDTVNKQLDKTSPSLEEVYKKYTLLKTEECVPGVCGQSKYKCVVDIIDKNTYDIKNIIILILLVIIVAILFYKKNSFNYKKII